ncbi:MAG TPA: UDP-2,4-diacetamido-2,4,6-trideoxy-beta-L-altropyranose hydrolase [Allosphingosinicella sp.]|nr:UDP-2,4-diacetamido-2,4,6-trideoxy-beta-L-altropyranose hydrolase [Allosphingosinicella sp.]
MRVAIRADASVRIGIGHVRRCAVIAEALAARGDEVVFVARRLGVAVAPMVAGFDLVDLPAPAGDYAPAPGLPAHAAWAAISWEEDAAQTVAAWRGPPPDVVVVDHYAFDRRWHETVRDAFGCRIVAVDDLGDRPLDAALIVDHNHAADYVAKHAVSAPYAPRILGGPYYALLSAAYRDRPDFMVRDEVAGVGIFLGGSDVDNATATAWQAVRAALGPDLPVEIVSTSANPHLPDLRRRAEADPAARLTLDLPDLAGFFAAHDLQVGAGGGAVWERCCIGAPSVALAFADNHIPVLAPLDKLGVLCFSPGGRTDPARLGADIAALAADAGRRRAMSAAARALVDGAGAGRVGDAIHAL